MSAHSFSSLVGMISLGNVLFRKAPMMFFVVSMFPYIGEQTINDCATVKNGEAVFTLTSPRSSAPGTDRGTLAAILFQRPDLHTSLFTNSWRQKGL